MSMKRANYTSYCRVFLVSDAAGSPIEISGDVVACQTSKTISAMGTAQITLVPRRDYLNLIYPNDVIVIYFSEGISDWDLKSGKKEAKYIKNFFGYVDSIRQSTAVDQIGNPTTRINVFCSDFQKVFERTAIYTNAFFDPGQEEILKQFVAIWGGVQFFTAGLLLSGTPATVCNTLILNLLGFGSQWQLPQSYPINPLLTKDITKPIHPDNPSKAVTAKDLADSATRQKLFEKLSGEINLKATDFSREDRNERPSGDVLQEGEIIQLVTFDKLSPKVLEALAKQKTLLDILDRRYIESFAVDGFWIDAPQVNLRDSLWQSMVTYANRPINEIFCDLRLDPDKHPIKSDGSSGPIPAGIQTGGMVNFFSIQNSGKRTLASIINPKNPDEVKNEALKDALLKSFYSVDEFGVPVHPSYSFVPAVVLRECPFEYDPRLKYNTDKKNNRVSSDNGIVTVISAVSKVLKEEAKQKESSAGIYAVEIERSEKAIEDAHTEIDSQTYEGTCTQAIQTTSYINEESQQTMVEPISLDVNKNLTSNPENFEKAKLEAERRSKEFLANNEAFIKPYYIGFAPVFFSDRDSPEIVHAVEPRSSSQFCGIRYLSKDNPYVGVPRAIDSVHIDRNDIILEDVGRSDHDLINLFHITNNFFPTSGVDKTIYRTFTPVFHAESVRRFGLRVMEHTTPFGSPAPFETRNSEATVRESIKALPKDAMDARSAEEYQKILSTRQLTPDEQKAVEELEAQNAVNGRFSFEDSSQHLVGRWNLLMDMWSLHAPNYLSGSFQLRGMPQLRVGYRLDVEDLADKTSVEFHTNMRKESYYVESVTQYWTITDRGGNLRTTAGVTRGQPSKNSTKRLLYSPPLTLVMQYGNLTLNSFWRETQDISPQNRFIVNSGYQINKRPSVYKSVAKPEGINFRG